MTNKEYQEKFGEEAFNEMKARNLENKKRRRMGLPPLPRKRRASKEEVEAEEGHIQCKVNAERIIAERPYVYELIEKKAAHIQKELKSIYSKVCPKQFILIVEPSHFRSSSRYNTYNVDLYRLHMGEAEREEFKRICSEYEANLVSSN